MSARSPQLEDAYKLRDALVKMIQRYESNHPGIRVVIYQEYGTDEEAPARAKVQQVWVDAVALDGTAKSTTRAEV